MEEISKKRQRIQYEKVGEFVSIFERDDLWQANWLDGNGRQRRKSLHVRSKKEARLRALKLDAQILAGDAPQRRKVASIEAVTQAYDDSLVAHNRAKKTLSKYRKVFKRVKSLATDRNVSDMRGIDLSFADAYRKTRADENIAPKTMHVELTILKQLGNFAFRRGLVATNALSGLKLKRPKNTPQPWWTLAQMESILEASEASPYYSLFCLLGWTGLRVGEAKHLTWDDVDLERGVLHVREKWVGPAKHDKWTPKGQDQRVVPLCPPALALLSAQPRLGRWVFTAPPTAQFPARDRQIDERRALYHLHRILKPLGLKGKLHSFRHSLISYALSSGTPEATVRAWAGHVDGQILKVYTHIADSESKAQMARLFPMSEIATSEQPVEGQGTEGGDSQP